MKKIASVLFIALGLIAFNQANAQSSVSGKGDNNSSADLTCYQKYEKASKERGGKIVDDGEYPNVIITMRRGNECECLMGKVIVEMGLITKTFVKLEDGKFEPLNKKFKTGQGDIFIKDGISKSRYTIDGEIINVVFADKINPKKANVVKAPEPPADF